MTAAEKNKTFDLQFRLQEIYSTMVVMVHFLDMTLKHKKTMVTLKFQDDVMEVLKKMSLLCDDEIAKEAKSVINKVKALRVQE